jgi:hypothetical protein
MAGIFIYYRKMKVSGSALMYAVKKADNMHGIIQMRGHARRTKRTVKTQVDGIALAAQQKDHPAGEISVYQENPQFIGWTSMLKQLYNRRQIPRHLKGREFYDLGEKMEIPAEELQLTEFPRKIIGALIARTVALTPGLFTSLRPEPSFHIHSPKENQQLLPKAFRQMSQEEGNLWSSRINLRTKITEQAEFPIPIIVTSPQGAVPNWIRRIKT